MDVDPIVDRVDDLIVERSRLVVAAFLLSTLVFGFGLGNVSTAAGTQQFSEDIPAEEALQRVQDDFGPSFAADEGSTQLIQSNQNVLSKPAMLRMLRTQDRLERRDGLRVTGTSSAAGIVATTLNPEATTTEEQIDAVEGATPREIDDAVRTAADRNPQFTGLLSSDFNRDSASASATIALVTHQIPAGIASGSGQGGSSPLTGIQLETKRVVAAEGGSDITVFGNGILSAEFGSVIGDSLIIVVPAAVVFILLFLTISYRDLADLFLGVLALAIAIVWTFGFMGLAGIPFGQILISVPPLLLAVGIDFGIHSVNRYREELVVGYDRDRAMGRTTHQLLVAFFIVTGTTVIGFLSNLSSSLPPIRDFGIVAGIGIVFTFLIFGIFLPAAKIELDRLREQYPIPTFSTTPLGAEGSRLGRVLSGGVPVARHAAVPFLLLVLVVSGGVGYYATGVDTTFSNEDFLPPEETPGYLESLPEPFAPGEYTVTATMNFLEENFESSQSDSVTIYVEGPMTRDTALESLHRAGEDPPDSFVRTDGRAESTSIVTVIQDHAERDPEFAALVERNDRNDNGVPDDNLDAVYDSLLDSPARGQALQYLSEDRTSARVVYTVKADAAQDEVTADARAVAEDYRMTAIATGGIVVFEAIATLIFESAIVSLAIALGGTAVFLLLIYWVIEGRPSLGVANLVPIVVTVTFVAASMRVLGISFNAFTATILALTIGLGIDYSVHVTHRFADEYKERELFDALDRTVRGTGGALAGSMLTTVFGIGVLVLAVFPVIGQFGILTGLSVIYAFVTSLFVLPPTLAVWARAVPGDAT
jgi:predicted RND superfamily exporter protein